ncbi:MAG: Gfo/Idh/MocA family oxidoreductase [Armatimonadetes bacterium]|nr:Gfo/Idh/MocA family oxidoreductase [Armatimonadota bacterium]
MDPVRFGIVGAGGIAALSHVPQLKALGERVEVTWLSGRKEHRLRRLQAELSGRPRLTTDYRELVAADDVDAVIVATPHPLHVEPGIAALQAGKHLMVQKPLCGDLDEAHAFCQAADRSDRTVFVLPHAGPEVVAARAMLDRGELGQVSGALARHSHGGPEVYYAEVRDAFGEPPSDDLWFFDAEQASVGALFDMGVYAVARLVALLGTARQVIAATATVSKPTRLEDTATLLITFENGALATAETGWVDPARTAYWRVHGSAGKLWSPGEAGAALTHWVPTSSTREHAPPQATNVDVRPHALGGMHEHFLDCLTAGKQPPFSHARAARHVTEILLAGLRSAQSGRAVELETAAT